jgi:hypothetical protein
MRSPEANPQTPPLAERIPNATRTSTALPVRLFRDPRRTCCMRSSQPFNAGDVSGMGDAHQEGAL